MQFSLIKLLYYTPGLSLRGLHNDSKRSRNLPRHWDKDRNGVRLVPLKLFLSRQMPPSGLLPWHPLPQFSWACVLEGGGGGGLKCLRLTKADILGEPHILTLDSLEAHTHTHPIELNKCKYSLASKKLEEDA